MNWSKCVFCVCVCVLMLKTFKGIAHVLCLLGSWFKQLDACISKTNHILSQNASALGQSVATYM